MLLVASVPLSLVTSVSGTRVSLPTREHDVAEVAFMEKNSRYGWHDAGDDFLCCDAGCCDGPPATNPNAKTECTKKVFEGGRTCKTLPSGEGHCDACSLDSGCNC